MNFFDLFSFPEQPEKKGRTRQAISISTPSAQFSPRDYESFAAQGYQANVIGFKAISMIAKSAAALPLKIMEKRGKEFVESSSEDAYKLLKRPNPMQSKSAFFEASYSFYMISGNSFTEKCTTMRGRPYELWVVNPAFMEVNPGEMKLPKGYTFKFKGEEMFFEVDQISGECDLLHTKTFHPTNHWWGQSYLEAALYSLDQHNEASKWNLAILQNGARPSGALKVRESMTNSSATLTDEQYENLKLNIRQQYQGGKNAGQMLLLEGGLEWEQMGMSQSDLDWLEGKNLSAREIALALGLPPVLLGIQGDTTYSNYKEAKMSFYEETVIPLAEGYLGELSRWLSKGFARDIHIKIDMDKVDALAPKRQMKFEMLKDAAWLTINEKRVAMGEEELEGLDVLESQITPLSPLPEQLEDEPKSAAKEIEVKVNFDEVEKAVFHKPEEIKQVNLLTKNEKNRAFEKINQLRNFYVKSFEDEVAEVFEELSEKMGGITATTKIAAESQSLRILDSYNEKFQEVFEKHLRRSSSEFGRGIIEGAKSAFNLQIEKKNELQWLDWVRGYVKTRSARAVTDIQGTNEKQVRKAIREALDESLEEGLSTPKIGQKIREKISNVSASRATLIARTEVGMASNTSSLEAAKSLQIPNLEKEWVSAQDERVRPGDFQGGKLDSPNHIVMNGAKVGQNEKFVVPPGDEMDGPGDSSAPVGQLVNCRCVLVFAQGSN
jgi:HK97 family phage portal protein